MRVIMGILGIFNWLKPAPPLDAATQALIGRAVAMVDPMMKQVGGHERKLAPTVRTAYDYCERLALAIPGPFPISRAAFASDPLVHALFGSADDVEAMLATSKCVRDYLDEQTGIPPDHCCALLGMRPKITAGFGARLAGEVILRDEPQKTLTFADHTLAEPSPDLDAVHLRLAGTMFDGLIKGFIAHVDEVREERQELRDAQAMERAQLRAAGPESHTRRLGELQERLRLTGDTLQPERLIETLAAYLADPAASLHIEPLRYWVNRFGILVEDESERSRADALRFVELTTRDLRRWVVMIVKFDRTEARAIIERFEERRRYIVI
jgi:hypothetical protein